MANIEMVIDSIRVSLMNNQRVVVLKEKTADRYLPIWIGPAEADAITVKIQNISVPRPLTHDFICSIADIAGLTIESAIMNKLENDTHYAKLVVKSRGKSYEIDCRPSDAIAVAVRAGAPVFADEKVLNEAGVLLDPETGEPIVQRKDDEKETVQKRLNIYHDQTSPLIAYYSKWAATGEQGAPTYVKVEGSGTVDEIKNRALDALS